MVTAVLAGIQVLANVKSDHAILRKPVGWLLALIGIGMLTYTIVFAVRDWETLDKGQELRKLAIPIWLTLGVLPFVFGFALIATYGQVFTRMKAAAGQRRTSVRSRFGVMLELRLRLLDLGGFTGEHARRAGNARTVRGGREAVRQFKADREAKRSEERRRHQRLAAMASVKGVDEDGRQLDQREVLQTRRALRWLAVCQGGQHNNQGGRYREDMVSIVGDFSDYGLPDDHGVQVIVRKDGQAWYAYRETIGGWVLGVGSRTRPPDQWFYSGPTPPKSYPRPGDGWGSSSHDEPPDWR